jgi:hypothetical protein
MPHNGASCHPFRVSGSPPVYDTTIKNKNKYTKIITGQADLMVVSAAWQLD